MNEGCGEFLKKGIIRLSIKCGSWDLQKRMVRYCDSCEKKFASDGLGENDE